jgi:hypothetical protein
MLRFPTWSPSSHKKGLTPVYPQKLALTSPASGGSSVGIVRSRIKATRLLLCYYFIIIVTFLVSLMCVVQVCPTHIIPLILIITAIIFFFGDPIYLQAVIIHSANGGKC